MIPIAITKLQKQELLDLRFNEITRKIQNKKENQPINDWIKKMRKEAGFKLSYSHNNYSWL